MVFISSGLNTYVLNSTIYEQLLHQSLQWWTTFYLGPEGMVLEIENAVDIRGEYNKVTYYIYIYFKLNLINLIQFSIVFPFNWHVSQEMSTELQWRAGYSWKYVARNFVTKILLILSPFLVNLYLRNFP